MFRRRNESDRALLKVIEQQQRTIDNLTDRIMFMSGHTWTPPPLPHVDEREPYERPTWTPSPEQEPMH